MTTLETILLTILVGFYFAMLIFLGIATLRKGRVLFFILGIFFPLFWIIGGVLPPSPTTDEITAQRAEHDRLYTR